MWDKDINEQKIYKAVAKAIKKNETQGLTKNQNGSQKISNESTHPHNIYFKWLKK